MFISLDKRIQLYEMCLRGKRRAERERDGCSGVWEMRKGRESLESVSSKGKAQGKGRRLGLEGCYKKTWLQSCLSREIKGPWLDLRQWGTHPWGARCFCGQGLCSLSGWLSATWLRTDMRDWLENCYAWGKKCRHQRHENENMQAFVNGTCLSLWFMCPGDPVSNL